MNEKFNIFVVNPNLKIFIYLFIFLFKMKNWNLYKLGFGFSSIYRPVLSSGSGFEATSGFILNFPFFKIKNPLSR